MDRQARKPVLIQGETGAGVVTTVLVNDDGSAVSKEQAVVDLPEIFEDTNFVSGESPVVLDVNDALGRNATSFEIINDGPGDFTVALSNVGTSFGDESTVKSGEIYRMLNISIDSIQITHVADSAYRVRAI